MYVYVSNLNLQYSNAEKVSYYYIVLTITRVKLAVFHGNRA